MKHSESYKRLLDETIRLRKFKRLEFARIALGQSNVDYKKCIITKISPNTITLVDEDGEPQSYEIEKDSLKPKAYEIKTPKEDFNEEYELAKNIVKNRGFLEFEKSLINVIERRKLGFQRINSKLNITN